jgi:PiT family inorganic phosphate transporter
MIDVVVLTVGFLALLFVGINIGGSSTGIAFGPIVGSKVISMWQASTLMAGFSFLGAILIGPRVTATLGQNLIPSTSFSPFTAVSVLVLTGIGLLLSNWLGISSSTSNVTVFVIAVLGISMETLNYTVLGEILAWWVFSGVLAFWVAMLLGRYFYDKAVSLLRLEQRKRLTALIGVIGACFMAFAAGANNVANAVAPLIGAGVFDLQSGVVYASVAIAAGGFILGPWTTKTLGEDITSIDANAAILIQVVAGSLILLLSLLGIPASMAHIATLTVIGLGWGRATKRVAFGDELKQSLSDTQVEKRRQDSLDLFDYEASAKVVKVWVVAPMLSGLLAVIVFFGSDYFMAFV